MDITTSTIKLSLSTNELATCDYSIDGGTNITMTSVATFTHETIISSPTNGEHNFTFYCTDLASLVGSALVNNINVRFISSTPGGGTPSGGSIDEIKILGDLEISSEIVWKTNVSNLVIIKTYDEEGDLVNVDNISFLISDNLIYTYTINNFTEGKYLTNFIFPTSETSNKSKLIVLVEKDGVKIERFLEFKLIEENKLDKFKDRLEREFDEFLGSSGSFAKIRAFFNEYGLNSFLVLFAFAFLVLLLIILYFRRKKPKKQ